MGSLLLIYCLCERQHSHADGKIVLQLPYQNLPESLVLGVGVSPRWQEPIDHTGLPEEEKPVAVSEQPPLEGPSRPSVQNLIVDSEKGVKVELPKLQPSLVRDSVFLRGNYRGILAWNGRGDDEGEELLIVESVAKSTSSRSEAVLSVIPLPGKPISIERLNCRLASFDELLEKKFNEAGIISGKAAPAFDSQYPRIASYHVFVLNIDVMDTLVSEIKNYIDQVYSRDVLVDISPEEMAILQSYWDRGFRYFAFDISVLSDQPTCKMPLMFHFQSPQVYFPLHVGAIGGTGETLVDLIVLTPDKIVLSGAVKDEDVILVGNTIVNIELSELETIQPAIVEFFRKNGCTSVLIRTFLIEGKTDQFKGDFTASPIQSEV